jgi:tetratricopeptide (TPR) repeat protein
MADNARVEDLRRRVQKDPASIAFAQLAEECRRAEQYQEAVDVCRAGLELHPGYLSARVTLGRALIELDHLDEAQTELELVLSSAPENLAAIRGLAEIYHRRGSLAQALKQYRAALALARNDPDLERTVTELARAIEPKPPAPLIDGLSFEEMASEFMKHSPPPPVPPSPPSDDPAASAGQAPPPAQPVSALAEEAAPSSETPDTSVPDGTAFAQTSVTEGEADISDLSAAAEHLPPPPPTDAPAAMPGEAAPSPEVTASAAEVPVAETGTDLPAEDATRTQACHAEAESGGAERRRGQATIAALDQWLDVIHVARAQRRP